MLMFVYGLDPGCAIGMPNCRYFIRFILFTS
jgi:hypothetical protein